ncbi:two-component sensor histidine kinase [Alicyclobacillus contaminans]|nr:two-component sensor histidine kinase [Alicyclobacillus contaminans]
MKLKIAVLAASVLFCILVALGGFIYFTVYTRVTSIQNNELANTAQSIGQYYSAHAQAVQDPSASQHLYRWLAQYSRHDQDVVLFDSQGNVVAAVGRDNLPAVVARFRPVASQEQKTFALDSNQQVTYTVIPVMNESGAKRIGWVVLASDASAIQEYMESLLTVLAVGCLGAVVLAGFGGYLIAAAALRPMHQLIEVVEGIEANRLSTRVPHINSRDEVGRLAATFNNMLGRIERSFAQQRRFVADASHEIRTPLTTILGYTNLLRRWGKTRPDVLERGIHVIAKESNRLLRLSDDLLLLAGLEATTTQLVSEQRAEVDSIAADVVEQLSVVYPDVAVDMSLAADAEVRMTPEHLRQVLTNVMANALKYTEAGGQVTVQTERTHLDRVLITVADTGMGIPAEDLPHVFERFYRADKSRERKRGAADSGWPSSRNWSTITTDPFRWRARSARGLSFALNCRWPRLPHPLRGARPP